MDKLRQCQAREQTALTYGEAQATRGMQSMWLVWLTFLLTGLLACCAVPERASQAFAEEGSTDSVVATGDGDQTAPTEDPQAPTEGNDGATGSVSAATEEPRDSTEGQLAPTEPDTSDAPAEAAELAPAREVVLTSESSAQHAIREVVALAQRRPLLFACVTGATSVAVVVAWYALSRYHSRPYAQRRRRRHYVA